VSRRVTRREALRIGALAGAGVMMGAAGCAPRVPAGPVRPPLRLAPVRVSPDRVIRAIAGLRPFRPSGFVVRAERFDDTTVVHNYGHGGAGISLSWGSSDLAVELVAETGERQVAVVGCGALGLTTARLLQDRGHRVTIYAKDLPPHTTSNVAGGQWGTFSVSDSGQTTPEYDRAFERAARFSHRHFQHLAGEHYGVRWIDNYIPTDSPSPPARGSMSDLYPGAELLGPGEHPFPTGYVRRHSTMMIEPAPFLDTLTRDFLLRGGTIEVRSFRDASELVALEERTIVNCTGLGSRELFGDRELVPVRGQLVILLPQPEVNYILLDGGGHYMFPRRDGILLGGTQERGEWSTEPDPETTRRLLDGHRTIFEGMNGVR
jgi:D-amino-acid oxidase